MTQMLLFDAPGEISRRRMSVAPGSASETDLTCPAGNVAAQVDCQPGLHQMGDLARLVLLRYDLVAKRRAILAARRNARGLVD